MTYLSCHCFFFFFFNQVMQGTLRSRPPSKHKENSIQQNLNQHSISFKKTASRLHLKLSGAHYLGTQLLSTPRPLPTRGNLPFPASTLNSWFCVSTRNQDLPPVTPTCLFGCLWSLCWGSNPMQERQDQLSWPGATELALR